MFLCPHCPYVKHIQKSLAGLLAEYRNRPLGIVAISSNDVGQHPEDGPDGLRDRRGRSASSFPTATTKARRWRRDIRQPARWISSSSMWRSAWCTAGSSSSRPKNSEPVTGADLRAAIDAVLAGQPQAATQRPSIGCNIKWKPGQGSDDYR